MSSYSATLISSFHNYCVLNRILFREEENLAGLKSSEIKGMASDVPDFYKATNLRTSSLSHIWVTLEFYRGKIYCIRGVQLLGQSVRICEIRKCNTMLILVGKN